MYGLHGESVHGQLAIPLPYVPLHSQTEYVAFSSIYGAFSPGARPSDTTNDCFAGILKYWLKSYDTSLLALSGSGTGVLDVSPSYTMTSPLLIGTTFHDPSTQSQTILLLVTTEVDDICENLSQARFPLPLSIVSLAPGVIVQIPIFPPELKSQVPDVHAVPL